MIKYIGLGLFFIDFESSQAMLVLPTLFGIYQTGAPKVRTGQGVGFAVIASVGSFFFIQADRRSCQPLAAITFRRTGLKYQDRITRINNNNEGNMVVIGSPAARCEYIAPDMIKKRPA